MTEYDRDDVGELEANAYESGRASGLSEGYDLAVAALSDDDGPLRAWLDQATKARWDAATQVITPAEAASRAMRRAELGTYPPRHEYAAGLAAIKAEALDGAA